MKKSGLILLIVIFILLLHSLPAVSSLPLIAMPIAFPVQVDGQFTSFGAYLIEGNSYFKLRDVAYSLNGAAKQFAVGWDSESNAIVINSGYPYSPVGGEMTLSATGGRREAIPTTATVYLDSWCIELTAYNIGGNNYFMLRDLGQALDFGVIWDEDSRCIRIETGQSYMPDDEQEGILAFSSTLIISAAVSTDPVDLEVYKREVVRLTNEERVKRGLTPLIADSDMFAASQIRAEELPRQFSHTRLNNTRFYTVLDELGIEYAACSENIAMTPFGPERVVELWMDSDGHRKNILGNYTKIGVGIAKSADNYYWEMSLLR
jgi:hypothetical protein